ELGEAHALLAPLLGLAIAPTLFGIALLCCGINSTVTATLAGQIVMEVVTNPEMLYLALGILGATVMPHNLYLLIDDRSQTLA
ncbi:divalent metal cation transporter, partial [Acinetobacter baumannii]